MLKVEHCACALQSIQSAAGMMWLHDTGHCELGGESAIETHASWLSQQQRLCITGSIVQKGPWNICVRAACNCCHSRCSGLVSCW